jgi:hypothetical protein
MDVPAALGDQSNAIHSEPKRHPPLTVESRWRFEPLLSGLFSGNSRSAGRRLSLHGLSAIVWGSRSSEDFWLSKTKTSASSSASSGYKLVSASGSGSEYTDTVSISYISFGGTWYESVTGSSDPLLSRGSGV